MSKIHSRVRTNSRKEMDVLQGLFSDFEAEIAFAAQKEAIGKEQLSKSDGKTSLWFGMELRRSGGPWFGILREAFQAGYPLILGIVKNLDLPPGIRRRVEASSKFFLKKLSKKKYGYDIADMEQAIRDYLSGLETLRGHLEVAREALRVGTIHAEDGTTTVKVSEFTLVNTSGFSDQEMAPMVKALERASHLGRAIGLEKVLYGDVYMSKRLSPNAHNAAFYDYTSDSVFVRGDRELNEGDALLSILHELAHRYRWKFVPESDIKTVFAKVSTGEILDGRSRHTDYPKPGETVDWEGKHLVVVRPDYTRNMVVLRDADSEKNFGLSINDWYRVKTGVSWRERPTNRGFITPYAAKNPEENFAEMVAYHALGRLPEAQVKLIEPILGA